MERGYNKEAYSSRISFVVELKKKYVQKLIMHLSLYTMPKGTNLPV